MDQSRKMPNARDGQVHYCGRWVSKEHFRVFVYDDHGNQRLAGNYPEFESLIASGIWYASKPEAADASNASKNRKHKHDVSRSDS